MAKQKIYSAEKLDNIIKMYEKKLKKVQKSKNLLKSPQKDNKSAKRRSILLCKKENSELYLQLKIEQFKLLKAYSHIHLFTFNIFLL